MHLPLKQLSGLIWESAKETQFNGLPLLWGFHRPAAGLTQGSWEDGIAVLSPSDLSWSLSKKRNHQCSQMTVICHTHSQYKTAGAVTAETHFSVDPPKWPRRLSPREHLAWSQHSRSQGLAPVPLSVSFHTIQWCLTLPPPSQSPEVILSAEEKMWGESWTFLCKSLWLRWPK